MNARIPPKQLSGNYQWNHKAPKFLYRRCGNFFLRLWPGLDKISFTRWIGKMAENSLNQVVHCPETNVAPGWLKKRNKRSPWFIIILPVLPKRSYFRCHVIFRESMVDKIWKRYLLTGQIILIKGTSAFTCFNRSKWFCLSMLAWSMK